MGQRAFAAPLPPSLPPPPPPHDPLPAAARPRPTAASLVCLPVYSRGSLITPFTTVAASSHRPQSLGRSEGSLLDALHAAPRQAPSLCGGSCPRCIARRVDPEGGAGGCFT